MMQREVRRPQKEKERKKITGREFISSFMIVYIHNAHLVSILHNCKHFKISYQCFSAKPVVYVFGSTMDKTKGTAHCFGCENIVFRDCSTTPQWHWHLLSSVLVGLHISLYLKKNNKIIVPYTSLFHLSFSLSCIHRYTHIQTHMHTHTYTHWMLNWTIAL